MRSFRSVPAAFLPLAFSITLSSSASADPRPESNGTITAYDYAGNEVVLVHACPGSRLGPDYPKCLERVRARVEPKVCRHGAGKKIGDKTFYKYRMGTIKTLLSDSLACGSGGGSDVSPASGDGDEDEDVEDDRGKGTSAAYELSGKLIVSKRCYKTNGRTYDYVRCGQRVRDRAKVLICRERGKGLHKYLYRSGDNKPSQSSVYCKD